MRILLPSVLSSALALCLAPTQSMATVFDIKVSYYGSYDSAMANKTAIEANLKHFAEAVYESTNGAHKIGRVTIYTDGAFQDNTDILWVAACHPNANIGGRGTAGARIQHCDDMPNNANFLQKPRSGGFVIGHEWGHFTYSLYDEYQNSENVCGADPGDPCANDTPVPNALMNNTWLAVDENDQLADASWLNFSTSATNSTATNAQFRVYQASSWDTITRDPSLDPQNDQARGRKLYSDLVSVKPAAGQAPSLEISTAEGQQAAIVALAFDWKRGATLVATPAASQEQRASDYYSYAPANMVKMLLVDRSSSVSSLMLDAVKATVQQAIKQAQLGDTLGLVAFDSSAQVIFAPTLLDSEATRQKLLEQSNALTSSSNAPTLDSGLLATWNAYQAAQISSELDTVFYLFAAGADAKTSVPTATLAQALNAGFSVYTFDTGKVRSDATLLNQLAEDSDGQYYRVESSQSLLAAFSEAERDASSAVDVLVTAGQRTLNGTQDFPVYIDNSLGHVAAELVYMGESNAVSWSIVSPAGQAYALPTSHCESETDPETSETINYCYIDANILPRGLWQLRATGSNAPIYYEVSALPLSNDQVFFAALDSVYGDSVTRGQPIVLEAQVGNDMPITNLHVSGEVELPDGNVVDVLFKDDGASPDAQAGDGIYTASINSEQEGSYWVTVGFDNTDNQGQYTNAGISYAPGINGSTPAASLTPVGERFQRAAQLEVWVEAASETAAQ